MNPAVALKGMQKGGENMMCCASPSTAADGAKLQTKRLQNESETDLPMAVSGCLEGGPRCCHQLLMQHASYHGTGAQESCHPEVLPHLPLGGGAHLSEIDLPTEMSKTPVWKWLCKAFLGEVL